MPKLNLEEQKREVALIREVAGWPMWPCLPVKQYQKDGSFQKCATLVDRGTPGESIKIEPVTLYDMYDRIILLKKRFDELEVIARYNTIEEMVADDWVVD